MSSIKVYTIQMAKWRKAKELGVPFVDTTVKSGNRVFAPTWDMVMGVKQGTMTEEQYTREYECMMENTREHNAEEWDRLLSNESVALACYCKAGAFCHRYLLKEMVKAMCVNRGIEFIDGGEIT